MKKLPVAAHLTDQEYKLLMSVYANHNRSMGLKERENYSLSHIAKIVLNTKDKCINVHYSNGDWWHYTTAGKWY